MNVYRTVLHSTVPFVKLTHSELIKILHVVRHNVMQAHKARVILISEIYFVWRFKW